jgi:hypothetical protein
LFVFHIFRFTVLTVVKHDGPESQQASARGNSRDKQAGKVFIEFSHVIKHSFISMNGTRRSRARGRLFQAERSTMKPATTFCRSSRGGREKRVRKSTRLLSYFRKICPKPKVLGSPLVRSLFHLLVCVRFRHQPTGREFIRASVAHAVSRLKINRKSSSRRQRNAASN